MAGTSSALDPGTLVGEAIDKVEAGLGSVGGPALLVGAAVTALTVGWRFASRLYWDHRELQRYRERYRS